MDAKTELSGSTMDQQQVAVRICAGLLGIDEQEALAIDPKISLPAFWAVLQYRGLDHAGKEVAEKYLSTLSSASPHLGRKITQILADLATNPEWYPWSLTDAELDHLIQTNRHTLTVFKYLGFSPLSAGAVAGAFSKGLREKVLSTSFATIVKGTAKSVFALPAVVIGAYLHALDEAAAEEGFEKIRRQERAARERMAGQVEKDHGLPVNRLEMGPSPIDRAIY